MMRRFDAISWMWSEALAALEDAERRRGRYFGLVGSDTYPRWEPPVDVYETQHGLLILVALPGIAMEDVSLFVDAKGVIVQTQRVPVAAKNCMRIQRMEIPYGTYERRIDLPPGLYRLEHQRMVNGCLELQLTREKNE
jgi:HSP20 family molecular chaperone IbpA